MKQRQWKTNRQFVERSDAQHRWDQAYQSLLNWTHGPTPPPVAVLTQESQEGSDESRRLRSCIHPASGTNPHH